MLGVGTGEALNEVAVTGIEWPAFKERFARLRESVRLIRELWTDERVTFEGDYYRTDRATVYDRPERPVPVYVAAGGPKVARYAGRAGDGFICTRGKGMELYDRQAGAGGGQGPREGRARPDHRPDDRDQALVGPRPRARAREHPVLGAARADRGAEGRARGPGRDGARRRRAADRAGREALDRRLRPEEVVEQIKPYVDAGFDHLVFHAPGHDQERFLAAFAEQVLPRLRAL